jgi:hypothetical protein
MREPIEVLGLLVTADQTVDEAQDWTLHYTMGGPVLPGVRGWPDGAAAPSTAEVDEMADQGWVRITAWPSGKGRHFTVTGEGRRVWQEHEQDTAFPPADHRPAALDWETSRELLRRIYDVYVERGAPRRGIDALTLVSQHHDPNSARAQLDELMRGGYVDRAIDRPGRVRLVRPSTRTLEMFAGWPVHDCRGHVGPPGRGSDNRDRQHLRRRQANEAREGARWASRRRPRHRVEGAREEIEGTL